MASAAVPAPVMSGFLGVQYPGFLKAMKKRWCLLAGTTLGWFKAPQTLPCDPRTATLSLDVSRIKSITIDGRTDADGHPFFEVPVPPALRWPF